LSMLADVCQIDHATTGISREGMFVATFNWALKFCISCLMFFSGLVISGTGFDAYLGGAQRPETILAMRWWFSGATIALAVASYWLIGRYSITTRRLAALRPAGTPAP